MSRVLILSGAGLSADSGIKTFRDNGGLWEEYDVMEVCSTEGFRKDRQKVLDFYDKRRAALKNTEPNLAHKMVANIKDEFRNEVAVLTQNVDDLLERAGCKDVVHLHGELRKLRCEKCGFEFDIGFETIDGKTCPKCSSLNLRHAVVMFGEEAPFYRVLYEKLSQMELFVCIGTSGEVLNVAGYAKMAKFSILNNLTKSSIDKNFTKVYNEKAVDVCGKIADDIRIFMRSSAI